LGTKFSTIYDRFFGKITDDMYLEYTASDTLKDLRSLILDAIPGFEFPRQILSYTLDNTQIDPSEEYPTWSEIGNQENSDNNYYQQVNKYLAEVGSEGSIEPSESIIIDTSYFTYDLTDEE
jgi:hypothetical protein